MGQLFSEETITAGSIKFFYSHSSLLCWKRINWIAGCSKTGRPPIPPKQQLSCRTSFVMVLSDVVFGYHDSQTLCQLTSFCGGFIKERFYSNNPRRLEVFNMTPYKPLQALTRSPRSCKKTAERECLFSRRWGTFSAYAVITHFSL